MGNKLNKQQQQPIICIDSVDGVYKQKTNEFQQNFDDNLSGGSSTISSYQSIYSVSRPWSRISRRRWKESTLTLPIDLSKTAWPVKQTELLFLPEFPIGSSLSHSSEDFEVIEEINKGAFGKVYKVTNQKDSQLCALKVLSKSKIINDNSIRQVKEEAQIQKVCGHHPYIVSSLIHWQSKKRLYIVSEYISGGELFNLLKIYYILPEVLVRIYVAQIAFALDFLHNAGVIYRDLKPENLLLDKDGNIQLIDFGLSKWLSYGKKTRTICGTLKYMAPEITDCLEGYGHAVDWWSLGVIACLLLIGKYPSMRITGSEPSERIVSLPENQLDTAPKDLVLRLLQIEPTKRLRSLRTLQTIAFYKDFNFDDIRKKTIRPNDILEEISSEMQAPSKQFFDFEDFDEVFYTAL